MRLIYVRGVPHWTDGELTLPIMAGGQTDEEILAALQAIGLTEEDVEDLTSTEKKALAAEGSLQSMIGLPFVDMDTGTFGTVAYRNGQYFLLPRAAYQAKTSSQAEDVAARQWKGAVPLTEGSRLLDPVTRFSVVTGTAGRYRGSTLSKSDLANYLGLGGGGTATRDYAAEQAAADAAALQRLREELAAQAERDRLNREAQARENALNRLTDITSRAAAIRAQRASDLGNLEQERQRALVETQGKDAFKNAALLSGMATRGITPGEVFGNQLGALGTEIQGQQARMNQPLVQPDLTADTAGLTSQYGTYEQMLNDLYNPLPSIPTNTTGFAEGGLIEQGTEDRQRQRQLSFRQRLMEQRQRRFASGMASSSGSRPRFGLPQRDPVTGRYPESVQQEIDFWKPRPRLPMPPNIPPVGPTVDTIYAPGIAPGIAEYYRRRFGLDPVLQAISRARGGFDEGGAITPGYHQMPNGSMMRNEEMMGGAMMPDEVMQPGGDRVQFGSRGYGILVGEGQWNGDEEVLIKRPDGSTEVIPLIGNAEEGATIYDPENDPSQRAGLEQALGYAYGAAGLPSAITSGQGKGVEGSWLHSAGVSAPNILQRIGVRPQLIRAADTGAIYFRDPQSGAYQHIPNWEMFQKSNFNPEEVVNVANAGEVGQLGRIGTPLTGIPGTTYTNPRPYSTLGRLPALSSKLAGLVVPPPRVVSAVWGKLPLAVRQNLMSAWDKIGYSPDEASRELRGFTFAGSASRRGALLG